MYKVLEEDDATAAQYALVVMVDLYRRRIWTNAHTGASGPTPKPPRPGSAPTGPPPRGGGVVGGGGSMGPQRTDNTVLADPEGDSFAP